MKPTATLAIAAQLVTTTCALAFDSPPSTPEVSLRLRYQQSATHPGTLDAMAPDALLSVQWSVPPQYFAVRLADGPALALDLARHNDAAELIVPDPDISELKTGEHAGEPSTGLYTFDLLLQPPPDNRPLVGLPAPAPVPAPGAAIPLAGIVLAARSKR